MELQQLLINPMDLDDVTIMYKKNYLSEWLVMCKKIWLRARVTRICHENFDRRLG